MTDADNLRAQKATSTDPNRLEREAKMAEMKTEALVKEIVSLVKPAVEAGLVRRERVGLVLLQAFLDSGVLDADAEARVRKMTQGLPEKHDG